MLDTTSFKVKHKLKPLKPGLSYLPGASVLQLFAKTFFKTATSKSTVTHWRRGVDLTTRKTPPTTYYGGDADHQKRFNSGGHGGQGMLLSKKIANHSR